MSTRLFAPNLRCGHSFIDDFRPLQRSIIPANRWLWLQKSHGPNLVNKNLHMNGIIWYKCYKCYKLYNVISPWDPRHIPEAAKPQFAIGPQKCVVMGPVGELINAASVWTHRKIGIMRKESTKNPFRILSSNLIYLFLNLKWLTERKYNFRIYLSLI